MKERDKGRDGQLLHEEFEWRCNDCKMGVKSIDYVAVYNTVEVHKNFKGHHSGRLTITKIVETWK